MVGVGILPCNPKNLAEGFARFYVVNGVAIAQKFLSAPFDSPADSELLLHLKGSGFSVSVNAGSAPFLFSEANTALFAHRRQIEEQKRQEEDANRPKDGQGDDSDDDDSDDSVSQKAGGSSKKGKGKNNRRKAKKGKKKASPAKKGKGPHEGKQGEEGSSEEFVPAPPKRTAWSVFWALLSLLLVAILIGTWASRHDPTVARALTAVDNSLAISATVKRVMAGFLA